MVNKNEKQRLKMHRALSGGVKGIKGAGLLIKVLLVLLCALFLFYGYALYLNIDSWKKADRELMTTIYDKLFYYVSNLENDIQRIGLAQEQFAGKLEINLLSLDDGTVFSAYERLEMVREVQTYLSQFFYADNFLKNTKLHVKNMKRTIDCFGGMLDLDETQYQYLSEFYKKEGRKVCYYNGSLLIIQPFPKSVISEKEPLYIASAEIDIDNLKKQIENLSKSSVAEMLFVSNDNTWYTGKKEVYERFLKDEGNITEDTLFVREEEKHYYVIKAESELLDGVMYAFLPEDVMRQNKFTGNTLFFLFSAGAFVSIFLIYYILNQILGKPMKKLMEAFDIVKSGKMDYRINHIREDEFAFLYNNFNEMIHNINVLNHEVAKQEKLVVEAELKQLQYQINPHFLYNSLYLLYRLAGKGENEMIGELAQYLGGYYRYITKNTTRLVSIREEIEHCRRYVGIQQMRFMERIKITFGDLDHNYDDTLIPILIFQPIVENAFGHGVAAVEKGRIAIYFETNGADITFVVEDNGNGFTEKTIEKLYREFHSDKMDGVSGLVNVYKRVKGYFNQRGDIVLEKSRYGGAKISLKLYSKQMEGENHVSYYTD